MPTADVLERLRALSDVLIPGDDDFPAPSATMAPELAFRRLAHRIGGDGVKSLIALVGEPSVAGVERLEAGAPALFFELRLATYFSYYQQPEVIATLQRLGHDYHSAPQPLGYVLDPFDARPGRDLPLTSRGTYKETQSIEPVDIRYLPWFQEAERR